MSYDHWVGKKGNAHDGTRFTLQEILLSQLTNFLYDDGRAPEGRAELVGAREEALDLDLVAPHRDPGDGRGDDGRRVLRAPRRAATATCSRTAARSGSASSTTRSPSSRRESARSADEAIRKIAERRGVGRFLKLTETNGVYASHPLGGARMADEPGFGVVDDAGEVFGSEGLFCMDSSIIPTSFGVNPSLSISAVCERAAAKLVARAADFDLPAPPPGLKHRPPGVHVGPRVKPG